jgi:hypothetical protein
MEKKVLASIKKGKNGNKERLEHYWRKQKVIEIW